MATAKKSTSGDRYVALLRGLNLGGRRIPMPELAALFEKAGCSDVRTYIASGNVVFRAGVPLAKKIAAVIAADIEHRYGFACPVIVRDTNAMQTIARGNPYLRAGHDPRWLHVVFLADTPARSAVAALDPARSPGDEYVVKGGEIYLYLPNGAARSKLTNQYFDSKLKTVSSGRNWNTVMTLLELMQG